MSIETTNTTIINNNINNTTSINNTNNTTTTNNNNTTFSSESLHYINTNAFYLYKYAELYYYTNINLSKYYIYKLKVLLYNNNININSLYNNTSNNNTFLFCNHCNIILLPSINCKIRIKSGKRKFDSIENINSTTSNNNISSNSNDTIELQKQITPSAQPLLLTPNIKLNNKNIKKSRSNINVSNTVTYLCNDPNCFKYCNEVPGSKRSWRNNLINKSDSSKNKLKKRDSSLRAIVSSSSIAPSVKPANLTPSLFYKFQCDSDIAPPSLPITPIATTNDKDKKFLTLDEREALKKKEKELNSLSTAAATTNKPFSFSSNSISKTQLKGLVKNSDSIYSTLNKF